MNLENVYDLRNLSFSVNVLSCIPVNFSAFDKTDRSAVGRNHNLLHLITKGERSYTTDTKQLHLKEGALILIPHNTHYVTECQSECSGIGIRFDFIEDISLQPGVFSDWYDTNGEYRKLFQRITDSFLLGRDDVLHRNVLFLRILDHMTSHDLFSKNRAKALEPAVNILKTRFTENLPIQVYAQACSLSESYFRSIFKKEFGISPIKYRNLLRYEEVCRLRMLGFSIDEIADKCGFCDATYLRLVFKRDTGKSIRDSIDFDMI